MLSLVSSNQSGDSEISHFSSMSGKAGGLAAAPHICEIFLPISILARTDFFISPKGPKLATCVRLFARHPGGEFISDRLPHRHFVSRDSSALEALSAYSEYMSGEYLAPV